MCFAMHALKNLCHPSSRPFDCGVYTGEKYVFTPSVSHTCFISWFLNSAIVRQDSTASPECAIHMISVDVTDCLRIFIFDGYCNGKSC